MPTKKKGLGRGLDVLFAETESAYENAQTPEGEAQPEQEVKIVEKIVEKIVTVNDSSEVKMELIDPNPNQPRKNFDADAMNELADSIRVHGVIQPIVLNKKGDRYMIIAGERRYRAAKLAGLDTIPAVIREFTDQKVKEISIIENLQREDLNPVEAARAIRQLMDEFHFTQEEVAERLGKSRPAIANTLRLLSLNHYVLDMVENGGLSAGHARTLVVVDDPVLQMQLAKKGAEEQLSVRDFEKLVKTALNPPPVKTEKPKPEQSMELKDLVYKMQRTFATKVQAVGSDRKGRIYIDYFSRDDLDRICDLLEQIDAAARKE